MCVFVSVRLSLRMVVSVSCTAGGRGNPTIVGLLTYKLRIMLNANITNGETTRVVFVGVVVDSPMKCDVLYASRKQ